MLVRAVVALTALLCFAASAERPPQSIFLVMKFERNGTEIPSPSLLVQSAAAAKLRLDDQLKVELTATGAATTADVRMNVFDGEPSALALVGTPRLIVNYGQQAVVAWSKNGTAYKVTVAPRLYAPAAQA